MVCMQLALACSAHLVSHRPRSPCLHQQQQQRRSAPPGRRRRPGCCCEVQARRARPIRAGVGQAMQGQVRQPGRLWPWAHCLALGPLYGGPLGPSWAHGIYMGVLLAPNHFENFFRLRGVLVKDLLHCRKSGLEARAAESDILFFIETAQPQQACNSQCNISQDGTPPRGNPK